jgi:hypothetical protein
MELLEDTQLMKDNTVLEWLTNLNLQKYALNFEKENIRWVRDLIDIEDLEKYGVKILGDKLRIQGVLKGNDDMKREFKTLNTFGIRKRV